MNIPFPPRNGVSAKLKPKKQPAQRTPHALPIAQRRAGTIQQQPGPPSLLTQQPRPAYRPSNARSSETPHTPQPPAAFAPKTWLQQLQTYAAQHDFIEEFERVWTNES